MTARERRKIVALRNSGLTYGQIAKMMGITRSTVAGILFREGMTAKPKPQPSATWIRLHKPKVTRMEKPPLPEIPQEPEPLGDTGSGCAWLHGEASQRLFCGHETKPGSSWCLHHASRVFVPQFEKRRAA